MGTVAEATWQDIIEQVRLNHRQLARGWFANLELLGVEGGVVRIRAANAAQVRYLETFCRGAFSEAAQAATGRLVCVSFEPEQAAPLEEPCVPFEEPPLKLNPDYSFDHFVTGPCNRLAHAASLAVAEAPGQAYNPFFVYGDVGLGKTHLLQAICRAVTDRWPNTSFRFLSCETFINHFMEAVENGVLNQFRYRYRSVGILVIDDIQFLGKGERSQEEFFHTFNTLHQSRRQIILSADSSPSEIPSLQDRLVSRFNSGLVALLDRPCLETRMAIIQKKAKLRCIEVPDEVVHFVASRVESNIRELEGALLRIDALSQTCSGQITLETAREALGLGNRKSVKVPTILEVVAAEFGVKVSDIQGKKRSKAVTHPRHICMYLARQLTSQSLEAIGGYFGGRDHSTVLHASRSIQQQIDRDPQVRARLDEMGAKIKNTGR